MVEAITIKTPEGEIVPMLTAEEQAEWEKMEEEARLGLKEIDVEEEKVAPIGSEEHINA